MPLKLGPLLNELTIQDKELRSMRIPYDKRTGIVGGDFAWAQTPYCRAVESQYNAGKPVRIIALKARQLGFSTLSEAIIFNWLFMHEGISALCLANEAATAEALFQKTRIFWETWPLRDSYKLRYSTKYNMAVNNGSDLKIATAGNRMTGRGFTFHAVHLSEVAFYPDPQKMMLGLNSSVPNTHGSIMLLESTANGIGNYFHTMWDAAVEGESDYIPLFFPWWKHPEYQMATTLSVRSELNADEKDLLRMMKQEGYRDDWIFRHLHWRRWTLKNKVTDNSQFMQEYPSTPEEAFRMSGTPVFPEQKLKDAFHDRQYCKCHGGMRGYFIENITDGRVRFHKDPGGPATIYKLPSRTDRNPMKYFLGADPAETVYGDLASIQVITRDVSKPVEQLATFSARTDGPQLAIELMKMGRFYHNCMVCPEAEGGGQACIQRVLDSGYPSVWLHEWADRAPGKKSSAHGFSMNFNRKKWCVEHLRHLLFNDQLVLHDHQTYNQLRDYAYWDNGEMGNASPDGHDDAVMALCIATLASSTEPTYSSQLDSRPGTGFDLYSPYEVTA